MNNIYRRKTLTRLQVIKRKSGSTTNFVYFPKADLEKAGFTQDEELLIESKKGCIIIRNSLCEQDNEEIEQTPKIFSLNKSEISKEIEKFGQPIELQKELAIQIKNFLDIQIERELSEKGFLSDATRRWVSELKDILDKIQKAMYGDKSVNLHLLHKVSHSQIAMKIRKARNEN